MPHKLFASVPQGRRDWGAMLEERLLLEKNPKPGEGQVFIHGGV